MSEERYYKQILKLLENARLGMTITDLVHNASVSRTSVRVALAYLVGRDRIDFRQTGMAKVYYIK